jgi:hypothetical protein
MPDFEFTSPQGKVYTVSGPAGATKEQAFAMLQTQLKNAPAAPSSSDIPATPRKGPADPRDVQRAKELAAPDRTFHDDNTLGKLFGPVDAGITMLSSMAAGAVAPAAGFVKSAFNGKDPEKNASDIAEAMQYQPRTGTGAQLAGMAGKVLAPLGALPSAAVLEGAQAIGSGSAALRGMAGANAAAQGAQDAAAAAGAGKLSDLVRAPKPAMAGGGAALTADATLRAQRAANMPVPIKLTQGQQDRTFGQVQFEREAAKTPEGKAINDRYAEQNAQMGQNLDAFADQTGAQASSLRTGGKAVVDALEAKRQVKKAEITDAYNQARDSGEMAAPINIKPLLSYLAENQTSAELAPIITSIQRSIAKKSTQVPANMAGEGVVKADPLNHTITLNDLENVRQQIRAEAQPGTPNMAKGQQMINLIDQATEGAGGPQFQQARRLFENYSNEFTNRDVVDKLLRDKPGTSDRAVAYEDVMKHSLLNGSLDDTKHLFRVLEAYPAGTAPEVVAAGQQAAKELRGALMNHIKETMFSNSGADTLGNTVGSPAKLQRLVTELDKDGKLEAIYGKQGAQQIRDAKDLANDLYTSPTGTVNSSNNANRIVSALDKAAGMAGSVPFVGSAVKYAARRVESRALSKKVDAALNPPSKLSDMTGGQ